MKGSSPSQPVRGDGLPLSVGSSVGRPKDSAEALMAALSYVSFLGVIPLLLGQKSQFCRHHARQGLTYNIVYFVASAIAQGFALLVPGMIDLPLLLLIPHAVISVVCVVRTLSGHSFTLPFVSKLSQEFPF